MHAIRVNGFTRISKRTARKRFDAGQLFAICPANMVPGSSFASHVLISPESIADWKDTASWYGPDGIIPNADIWQGDVNATAWQCLLNNWNHFNASYGARYPAFYVLD